MVIALSSDSSILSLALVVLIAAGAGLAAGMLLDRRRRAAMAVDLDDERRRILSAAVAAMRQERADAAQAALDTAIAVASSKLGDQLQAGKHVIDRDRESVAHQVAVVNDELRRVGDLVTALQQERAQQFGQLTSGLESAIAVTSALADTTDSLRHALASPKSRGQWGERMAADVLTAAGFVEGVNFARERRVAGGTLPDYTFFLPKGHLVHMDVKFPIDNYLRAIEAADPVDADRHARRFGVDVRNRVRELVERGYVDPATTVDYLLLFIPNESVYGFLHENDPELIDLALGHRRSCCAARPRCSPCWPSSGRRSTTFLVERRGDEILAAIGGVRDQWQKFGESVDKAHRGLASAQVALDELRGPRSRQFERQLDRLEAVRDRRLLDLAGDGLGEERDAHLPPMPGPSRPRPTAGSLGSHDYPSSRRRCLALCVGFAPPRSSGRCLSARRLLCPPSTAARRRSADGLGVRRARHTHHGAGRCRGRVAAGHRRSIPR